MGASAFKKKPKKTKPGVVIKEGYAAITVPHAEKYKGVSVDLSSIDVSVQTKGQQFQEQGTIFGKPKSFNGGKFIDGTLYMPLDLYNMVYESELNLAEAEMKLNDAKKIYGANSQEYKKALKVHGRAVSERVNAQNILYRWAEGEWTEGSAWKEKTGQRGILAKVLLASMEKEKGAAFSTIEKISRDGQVKNMLSKTEKEYLQELLFPEIDRRVVAELEKKKPTEFQAKA